MRRRTLGVVLAAALVSLAGCSAGDPVSNTRQTARGLDAIAGLPQDGFTLGASNAPWTLSVMSTPTSYELDQLITLLPSVTDGFVRDGRLKLQMRTPTRGPYGANGEERAASGALLAAGLQGRYWDALIRFVANYRGGVTPTDLANLMAQSGVPDVDRAMVDRSSARIRAALDRADSAAAEVDGKGQVKYVLETPTGTAIDLTRQADKGRLAEFIGRAFADAP